MQSLSNDSNFHFLELFTIILVIFSAISFLFYGYNCVFTDKMKAEFQRYRLTELQRKITGISQIVGALGLLLGLYYPLVGIIAAGGLRLQMLMGFLVRLKIKDSFLLSFPSFVFMLLNGYLFFCFLKVF